jgi:2-isopropylmalate synthase
MSKERIYLFDTTLRDGQQTPGIDFSVEDKIAIARMLDEFGIDYVEGGYPGANPTDTLFCREAHQEASFVAFGMTKRAGVSASNDPGLAGLIQASKAMRSALSPRAGTTTCAWRSAAPTRKTSSRFRTRSRPHRSRQGGDGRLRAFLRRLQGQSRLCARLCARTPTRPARAGSCCATPMAARSLHEIREIVGGDRRRHPGRPAWHPCPQRHRQAVANSLAAVDAGVRQIQGTLNGIGERCGNANLVTLIPTLMLKPAFSDRFEIGHRAGKLAELTALSHGFDELLNRSPSTQSPYVGASAFATKAGIHASALLKDPRTYEHVPPESVGNFRKVMVSDQGGKSNFINALKRRGIAVGKDDPKLDKLIAIVKEREATGYAYEGADASFELLAHRTLGRVPEFFSVTSFRVMVERRFDAMGRIRTVSEAVVKLNRSTAWR